MQIAGLRRQRSDALEAIDEERRTALAPVERSIQQLKQLNEKLAEDLNQAVLARAQEDVKNVYLVAPAVPRPEVGSGRGPLVVLLGGLFGAVLGLAVAGARRLSGMASESALSDGRESEQTA